MREEVIEGEKGSVNFRLLEFLLANLVVAGNGPEIYIIPHGY
jgi:hypothetical protein